MIKFLRKHRPLIYPVIYALLALYAAMWILGHVRQEFLLGVLVTVYKKGPEAAEVNNQPLVMISSLRQVYERMITTLVRKFCRHALGQMGFLNDLGSKMAIARVVEIQLKGINLAADEFIRRCSSTEFSGGSGVSDTGVVLFFCFFSEVLRANGSMLCL